jgi:hypothetical protein
MAEEIRDRLKERARQVNIFLIESAMRIPAIQTEIKSFTLDDLERGI